MLGLGVPVTPVLSALRAATADLHHAIEIDTGVETRLRDPATRPDMVARMHRLHQAVEAVVSPWREALEWAGHRPERRSDLILQGLGELGRRPGVPSEQPPAATFGEALGWTYVAEGSLLGGRVIRRGIVADGISLEGLDFLDPHGDETGPRWRAFLHAMESACASGQASGADVIKGGQDAFNLAATLLTDPASAEFA